MSSHSAPMPADFGYDELKKLQAFYAEPILEVLEDFIKSDGDPEMDVKLHLRLTYANHLEKEELGAYIKKRCSDSDVFFLDINHKVYSINQEHVFPSLDATLLGMAHQYGLGMDWPCSLLAEEYYKKAYEENLTARCNLMGLFLDSWKNWYHASELNQYLRGIEIEENKNPRLSYILGCFLEIFPEVYRGKFKENYLYYYKKSLTLGLVHDRTHLVIRLEESDPELDKNEVLDLTDDEKNKYKLNKKILGCLEEGLARGHVVNSQRIVEMYANGYGIPKNTPKAALVARHALYLSASLISIHPINFLIDLTSSYHATLGVANQVMWKSTFNVYLNNLNRLATDNFESFLALCQEDTFESIKFILLAQAKPLQEKLILQFNLSLDFLTLEGQKKPADQQNLRPALPREVVHDIFDNFYPFKLSANFKKVIFEDSDWQEKVNDFLVGKRMTDNLKKAINTKAKNWMVLFRRDSQPPFKHAVSLKRKLTNKTHLVRVEDQLSEIEAAEKGKISYRHATRLK